MSANQLPFAEKYLALNIFPQTVTDSPTCFAASAGLMDCALNVSQKANMLNKENTTNFIIFFCVSYKLTFLSSKHGAFLYCECRLIVLHNKIFI